MQGGWLVYTEALLGKSLLQRIFIEHISLRLDKSGGCLWAGGLVSIHIGPEGKSLQHMMSRRKTYLQAYRNGEWVAN